MEEGYWTHYEAQSLSIQTIENLNNRSFIRENSNFEQDKQKPRTLKLTSLALKLLYFLISILVTLYVIQQSTDSTVPIYEMNLIELMKKL